jgi:hypothetical protein
VNFRFQILNIPNSKLPTCNLTDSAREMLFYLVVASPAVNLTAGGSRAVAAEIRNGKRRKNLLRAAEFAARTRATGATYK